MDCVVVSVLLLTLSVLLFLGCGGKGKKPLNSLGGQVVCSLSVLSFVKFIIYIGGSICYFPVGGALGRRLLGTCDRLRVTVGAGSAPSLRLRRGRSGIGEVLSRVGGVSECGGMRVFLGVFGNVAVTFVAFVVTFAFEGGVLNWCGMGVVSAGPAVLFSVGQSY